MKRLLQVATLLYPRAWRERYGEEFSALLEDSGGSWKVLFDVVIGAIKMRVFKTDLRLVLSLGLAGLAIAAVVAFRMPDRYQSEAVVRITGEPGVPHAALVDLLIRVEGHVLSRSSLAGLIQDPELNLYQGERKRIPIEEVIEQMKRKDLLIMIGSRSHSASEVMFSVRYVGLSPEVANRTTQRVLQLLIDTNLSRNSGLARSNMKVLDPPSLPVEPIGPNRLIVALVGLAIGLGAGILVAGIRRWPRVALMGIAGAFLAGLLSFAIPNRYVSTAVLNVPNEDVANMLISKVRGNHETVMKILRVAGKGANLGDLSTQWRSGLLHIRMESNDRFGAQYALQQAITELITALWETHTEKRIQVIDNPSPPTSPVFPNRWVVASLGLFLGLVAGILLHIHDRRRVPPIEAPA